MNDNWKNKIIVFCGPSGSGKTTVLRSVMGWIHDLSFYSSATSRSIRGGEKDGVDYYFLTPQVFQDRVAKGDFVEWEEVYTDTYYGTLKSELERIHNEGKIPVSDVDVKGAMRIKEIFGDDALVVFIKTPLELIRERLVSRGTETEDKINMRIARAEEEFTYEHKCDAVVENIDLNKAVLDATEIVKSFLEK